VSVNGKTIFSKLAAGNFPDFAAILKEVKARL
jgi:DNA polymerase III sliding clamp (beta) subunit (PCNA family)